MGDFNVSIAAGENLSILAVETESSQDSYRKDTKGGLGTSGMSVTIGNSSQSMEQRGTQTQAVGSNVGAIAGNVELSAGKNYTQIDNNLTAGTKVTEVDGEKLISDGNITVNAERIQIVEARETSSSYSHQESSSSGLSLGVSTPLMGMVQGLESSTQAIQTTDSGRMKALGAASLALQSYNQKGDKNSLAKNPEQAASVTFSLSMGSSHSESTSESQANGSSGSKVIAGGNIT